MTRARGWAGAAAVLFALVLGGCATPGPPAPGTPSAGWSGRLALQVQDKPAESFAAMFELRGTPQQGELALTSPIGGTLGLLQWQPGKAVLRSGSRSTEYDSLDALVAQVAGSPIPVAALFDWLRGVDTQVAGWRADLSQLPQGRIVAHRDKPAPEADLRVILER
jgi:outer membrane lipoprotein LolB